MRLQKKLKYIGLSELKGINILYENDFYELALLAIKVKEAADQRRSNVKSRLTINGLAKIYASILGFTDSLDSEAILNIVKKYGIPESVPVDYDCNI